MSVCLCVVVKSLFCMPVYLWVTLMYVKVYLLLSCQCIYLREVGMCRLYVTVIYVGV